MSSILSKVKLTPSPIRIGGITLELLTVEDISPLLTEFEKMEKDALDSFPYWVKIWESSIILASHLSEQNLDRSGTVLELGAGMGVVGLFLAALGHPVTLTDHNDDALALLERNAVGNNLASARIEKLDWNKFVPSEKKIRHYLRRGTGIQEKRHRPGTPHYHGEP
jgi:predicted nicotinamide N-methyase